LPGTISADGSRPDEVAIEATTVDVRQIPTFAVSNNPNLKKTPQPKKKKKKRKRKNTSSLDDDNLHPRKSARNDAESTPRMELEEAVVQAPNVRICLGFLVGLTGQPWSTNKTTIYLY
jgi:hypothetical protein